MRANSTRENLELALAAVSPLLLWFIYWVVYVA